MKEDLHKSLRDRWKKRILNSRKRYFFEYLGVENKDRQITLHQTLSLMKDDIVYVSKWMVNILLQIRAYGQAIKRLYGVGYSSQLFKMAHLAFVKRVKPSNFRRLHLFNPEKWRAVDDYVFFQTPSQRYLSEITCPQETSLFLDKFKFFQFCLSHKIHCPTIFAIYKDSEQIYPEREINLPDQDLFVKNRDGQMGWGAKKFSYSDNVYRDKNGTIYEKNDVIEYLTDYSKKSSVILQNVIVNHTDWEPFTPGALATCRIVTAKSPADNSVIPLFTVLRMPLKNSDTDNFSGGGLITKFDFETGIMGRVFSSHPINNQFEFSIHPHTGHKVEGEKLPHWNQIMEFTMTLHQKVESPFVGWDVSMTDQGCCVIEGSVVWSSGSCECAYQTPLTKTDYPLLFEQWMDKYSNGNG